MAFVLCGNFCQRGWEGEGGLKRYTSQSLLAARARAAAAPSGLETDGIYCRRLQRLDRPTRFLPSPTLFSFHPGSRTTRSLVLFHSTSTSDTYHLLLSLKTTHTESAIRFESLSITIFRAGTGHLPGRPNGAYGKESYWSERRGKRGYEAICVSTIEIDGFS